MGLIFWDDPVDIGASLCCLLILIKFDHRPRSPDQSVANENETEVLDRQGEEALYNDVVVVEEEDLYNEFTFLDESRDQSPLIDKHYSSESESLSIATNSTDESTEVIFIDEPPDPKGKHKQLAIYDEDEEGKQPIFLCMALVPTGLNKDEYRRVGMAEIWDLDLVEEAEEVEVTIV